MSIRKKDVPIHRVGIIKSPEWYLPILSQNALKLFGKMTLLSDESYEMLVEVWERSLKTESTIEGML